MVSCYNCGKEIEQPDGCLTDPHENTRPMCRTCALVSVHGREDTWMFMNYLSTVPPEPNYAEHVLANLTNRELLERLQKAMERVTYVNEEKKISCVHPKERPELWNNLSSAWNEAARRGYRQGDLGQAIASLMRKTGFLNQLWEDLGRPESWKLDDMPAWRRFERLVARIHKMVSADNCDVRINERVLDRTTGTPRQIDVTIRFKQGFYPYLVIVECRDKKAKISIGDVEEFARKVEDVRGHKGVMVTSSDFESGALEKAKFYGIETYCLSEAEELDWGEVIRDLSYEFPFAEQITFDPLDECGLSNWPVEGPLSYGEMYLANDEGKKIEDLGSLASRLSLALIKERLVMPTLVRVTMNRPAILRIEKYNVAVPIKGLEILFIMMRHIEKVRLEKPKVSLRYNYRDAKNGVVWSFKEWELPGDECCQ